MSKHREKHGLAHPTAQPIQEKTTKESTSRHVYVEPGVKIDVVQDIRDAYAADQRDIASHNKKQLFWTKIGAGLVFIYATLTAWQGYLTRTAVIDAREHFANDQRAWVGARELLPRGDKALTIVIANTGKTPALAMTDVAMPVQWCCNPDVMPGSSRTLEGVLEKNKAILMPGATHYLNVPIFDIPESIPAAEKPQMIQEVRGTVKYSDIFGKAHWTRFCFVAVGVAEMGAVGSDLPNYHFRACTHGNDTDDHPEPNPPGIRELPLD